MKRNSLLSSALVLVFLGLFVHYFFNHTEDFKQILSLNPILLGVVAACFVLALFINGLAIKILIKPFDKHLSTRDSFYVSVISSIGNYFGPMMGGTGLRALYLKKKVDLNYSDFASTLYGTYVITFLVSAVFGLISLALLYESFGKTTYLWLSAFFVAITVCLVWIIISARRAKQRKLMSRIPVIGGTLTKINTSWSKIVLHKSMITTLVRLTVINLAILMAINYTEFLLIDVNISFGSLMLYSILGSFSILISLTPGALGIREGLFLVNGELLGLTSAQILLVAVIDRGVQFFVMSVSWGVISISNYLKREK